MAKASELDLVEVSSNSDPSVCRIMDFGKYRYEQKRRSKEGKKKQHVIQVKEITMRPRIGEHDYLFKSRNIHKFLEEGNKVKVTMSFRGREIINKEQANKILKRLGDEFNEVGTIEIPPKWEGKNMVMILASSIKK